MARKVSGFSIFRALTLFPYYVFVANRWYASLGCWKDTDSFAVATLEGSDPLLKGSLAEREKPIDTCAQVAGKHNYKGNACTTQSPSHKREISQNWPSPHQRQKSVYF